MRNKKGGLFTLGIIFIVLIIFGFLWFIKNMNVETNVNIDLTRKETNDSTPEEPLIQLSNPASVKCLEDGYKLEMRLDKDQGTYGVCYDINENECEEWAYFRGECELDHPFND